MTRSDKKQMNRKPATKKRGRHSVGGIFITLAAVLILAAAVVVCGFFLLRYRKYGEIDVRASIELAGKADNLSYHVYGDGFLQCSGKGLTHFDKSGVLWEENFEMSHPLIDVCDGYAAVADIKQSDVYIYDNSGLVKRISSAHDILDVEIAPTGIFALITNDGDCNYIELKSVSDGDLFNVKSIFSSSGYLTDIALSPDGMRLAAAFIYVSQGNLESRVLFYDFNANDTDSMLVAGFNQYTDTLLTMVEYMGNDVICAVGDNAVSFYNFKAEPELICEYLDLEWEIQSLDINDKHILFVVKDDTGEHGYKIKAFNTSGKLVADVGFDFAYSKAVLAGRNALLYSGNDFQLLSFAGVKRFSHSTDSRIAGILAFDGENNLLIATMDVADIIKLK
ncbi:MAG: DUF5711 family protein [Lachnospiraceae bacterium]|jgi:hypothetical protein